MVCKAPAMGKTDAVRLFIDWKKLVSEHILNVLNVGRTVKVFPIFNLFHMSE